MHQYIIKGGKPLVGEVVIGGAKNAALGILAAAIMTDGQCLIDNMPNVRDTNVLLQAMEGIGATIIRKGDNEVLISGRNIDSSGDLVVDNEFIRKIRASYYLIGALLGKYKKAQDQKNDQQHGRTDVGDLQIFAFLLHQCSPPDRYFWTVSV